MLRQLVVGLAVLVSVTFSLAAEADDSLGEDTKSYYVGAALRLIGPIGFQIDNIARTATIQFGGLVNEGTQPGLYIVMRLFLMTQPLNPQVSPSYWTIAQINLPTLSPGSSIPGGTRVAAINGTIPDGTYYVYVGVFEVEVPSCLSPMDTYCLDSVSNFTNQVQVSNGNYISVAPQALAVEYFHSQFGHYFVTAQLDEIAALDSGAFAGWARTGLSFSVWTTTGSAAGLVDVCRFFTTAFPPKSSHFYTANAAECLLRKTDPVWQYEKVAFRVGVPNPDGSCQVGIRLYRLYNNGQTGAPNHRYTTSLLLRNQMIGSGFVPEDDNTFCVPS